MNSWNEASTIFKKSGEEIMKLCEAALKQDKQKVSNALIKIAEIEKQHIKYSKPRNIHYVARIKVKVDGQKIR